jgi:two-component system LytT family response regulator
VQRWRNLAVQGLAVATLAPTLVLASCILAAWILAGRLAPTPAEVAGQMLANTVLVAFCLSLLLAVIHVLPWRAAARPAPSDGWLERLTIGERGRLRVVELKTVDWIETQGNYQALHSGHEVHLTRNTSKGLAAKLDPGRFVRIHRRFIVATDRVREVEPLANGDALVRLVSGVALRQSRHHRDALRAHLLPSAAGRPI